MRRNSHRIAIEIKPMIFAESFKPSYSRQGLPGKGVVAGCPRGRLFRWDLSSRHHGARLNFRRIGNREASGMAPLALSLLAGSVECCGTSDCPALIFTSEVPLSNPSSRWPEPRQNLTPFKHPSGVDIAWGWP